MQKSLKGDVDTILTQSNANQMMLKRFETGKNSFMAQGVFLENLGTTDPNYFSRN